MLGTAGHMKEESRRRGDSEGRGKFSSVLAQFELPVGCPPTASSEVNESSSKERSGLNGESGESLECIICRRSRSI